MATARPPLTMVIIAPTRTSLKDGCSACATPILSQSHNDMHLLKEHLARRVKLCLINTFQAAELDLFTRVRRRTILRSPHPGSRIERPLGAPGSPSEGLPTEGQGLHVVVADRYAARWIVTAPQNPPPGPSAFLCSVHRKGCAHAHRKQAIRYPAVLQVASF